MIIYGSMWVIVGVFFSGAFGTLVHAFPAVILGAVLSLAYSLGLGIPFLLAALALEPFTGFMRRFRKRMGYVEKAMGALLVVTGVAFLTGSFTQLSFWLLETFPVLGRLG